MTTFIAVLGIATMWFVVAVALALLVGAFIRTGRGRVIDPTEFVTSLPPVPCPAVHDDGLCALAAGHAGEHEVAGAHWLGAA